MIGPLLAIPRCATAAPKRQTASIWDVLINGGAKKDMERCVSNLPKTKHSLWEYLPFQKESSVTFQHFQGQNVSFAECSPIPDQLTIVPGIVSVIEAPYALGDDTHGIITSLFLGSESAE